MCPRPTQRLELMWPKCGLGHRSPPGGGASLEALWALSCVWGLWFPWDSKPGSGSKVKLCASFCALHTALPSNERRSDGGEKD